jgi:DNA-binding GntR family transcriptional regulator
MPDSTAEQPDAERSLADEAYRRLEALIVTLRLAPGAAVTEPDLTRLLGIGRTPVREATHRLGRDGMILVKPRKGMFISEVSPFEQLTVLETRQVLERLLARSAARFANPLDRERLGACAIAMAAAAAAAAAGNIDDFMAEDKTFDGIVGEASRNRFASAAVAPLQTMSRRFWYAFLGARDLAATAERHLAIMEAIAAGDVGAADRKSDELMAHLQRTARKAIEASTPGGDANI